MKIPGFTAEASIYTTSTPYRGAYGAFASGEPSAVVPQDCASDCELKQVACCAIFPGCPFTGYCRANYRRCLRDCSSSSPPPDTSEPPASTSSEQPVLTSVPEWILRGLRGNCAEPILGWDRDPSCYRYDHPFNQCVSECLRDDPWKPDSLCHLECDSECPSTIRVVGCRRWEWPVYRVERAE
jgi:hypothetical protein